MLPLEQRKPAADALFKRQSAARLGNHRQPLQKKSARQRASTSGRVSVLA
jgi:hypothetical protein